MLLCGNEVHWSSRQFITMNYTLCSAGHCSEGVCNSAGSSLIGLPGLGLQEGKPQEEIQLFQEAAQKLS